jgi:FixJ family two-component response regulator
MVDHVRISLIDSNAARRAAMTYALAGEGIHAEPYEWVIDLPNASVCSGLFMVFDEGHSVETLFDYLLPSIHPYAVVALSERPALREVVRAMRLGAADYLSWPLSGAQLAPAVEKSRHFVTLRSHVDEATVQAKLAVKRLSSREREVLQAIAEGCNSREIGEKLGISPRTVEIHRANMINKLQAKNSPDAVRIAIDSGLLDAR